ncbi:MAG: nitrite reductase [Bdellovibrio sp. ArHS]|uniref:(2Fe-2S)-binding protein n=1 Tax=Bdellovibrio sp. ArHS TaxID=1569284 RepID=UPI00058284D0|nr:(2Fe-2S)-binding protein [Bdellovibrio sp. ArHS]KHD89649.1 MAG: nitrite reductase [Bdellovibrio sp. ArHS]
MKIKVELEGRDLIEVDCEGEDLQHPGTVKKVSILGCAEFMGMMQTMRRHFGNDLSKWPLPEGHDHSSLLLKEMILKLRGEWHFPYADEELCHCRSVPAHTVDQAVVAGAHTPEVVTRQTAASSNCGTCRPDVQKIIDYRLGKKTA